MDYNNDGTAGNETVGCFEQKSLKLRESGGTVGIYRSHRKTHVNAYQ